MEGKLKTIILILVAFLAASLFIIFNIQSARLSLLREYTSTKQRLTQKNEQLANELNKALQESKNLKDRLGNIERDLERITSEKDEIQRRLELVSREREELLERLSSFQQLQEEVKLVKNENKSLRERLATLQDSEAEIDNLRKENENLRQRIKEVKSLLKEKIVMAGYAKEQEPETTEVAKASGSVDLPPIVVSSSSISPQVELPYALEGKILNVNREHEFVVIDLGRNKGLKQNMVFEVLRDGEPIGEVKVIQIREEIAACDIIESLRPFELGDIVRY
jgi:archaellum component FlaC